MHYRLLVLGEDFPLELDGTKTMMGWYKTVWVEAADHEEAKAKSLEVIRSEPLLSEVPRGCGAKVSWEEIEEVEASEVPASSKGFTFFPMEN